MLEVLITLIILAFGLLGLINLQLKLQVNEVESYQRGQALVLLEDMAGRMRVIAFPKDGIDLNSNGTPDATETLNRLAAYVTGDDWIGVGGTFDCAGNADCEQWDDLLEGAAVSAANLGAMEGARGCIEQIEAGNPANGFCIPAQYRITVSWQGLAESAVPSVSCANGQYGEEGFRRSISTIVTIGTPKCL